jgi:hypothetical protein
VTAPGALSSSSWSSACDRLNRALDQVGWDGRGGRDGAAPVAAAADGGRGRT